MKRLGLANSMHPRLPKESTTLLCIMVVFLLVGQWYSKVPISCSWFYSLPLGRHLDCFQFEVIINKHTLNVFYTVLWEYYFYSSEINTPECTCWLYGNRMFSLIRNGLFHGEWVVIFPSVCHCGRFSFQSSSSGDRQRLSVMVGLCVKEPGRI